MKKLLVVILLACLIAVTLLPVSAANWTERISGGMSSAVGIAGEFTVTLSAWDNGDDTYGGQGQYYYSGNGNSFHIKVSHICTGIVASGVFAGQPYVVAIGPIFEQDGTDVSYEYAGIVVAEGGTEGDGIRVPTFASASEALSFCNRATQTSFPATVNDGNFNIRSKE